MANSDKDIKITPNTNQTGFPTIEFIGSSSAPIALSVLDDNSISFDGSEGQLFSINNNLTVGTIFSVNDVSGIPSIEVDADGTVSLAELGGNVGIGTSSPTHKLTVVGTAAITNISASTISSSLIPIADSVFDLGSPTNKWKDLYLTNASIYLGDKTISVVSGNLKIDSNYILTGSTQEIQATQLVNSLTAGSYLSGSSFDGSSAITWSVDATSANTASKVVVRDASGNFSAGTITATLFSGNLSGNATSATTATTATNANNIAVTNNTSTNATHCVAFVVGTSGNQAINVDSSTLTYNPSTNTLTVAQLAGNAATATSATSATTATTATNANNVAITDDTTTNATNYVTFVNASASNRSLRVDSSTLTYNPFSNTLTVANLAGNAATVTNGVYTNNTQTIIGQKTFSNGIIASAGVYLGNTGATAANLLNDYETGYFTPTYIINGNTVTGGSTSARYVKVGSLVTLYFFSGIISPATATNASIILANFPFAVNRVTTAPATRNNIPFSSGTPHTLTYIQTSEQGYLWGYGTTGTGGTSAFWNPVSGSSYNINGCITYETLD